MFFWRRKVPAAIKPFGFSLSIQSSRHNIPPSQTRCISGVLPNKPAITGIPSKTLWENREVVDPALLQQADTILSKYETESIESLMTPGISDERAIPSIQDVQFAPLEPDTNCDLIVISDRHAFSSKTYPMGLTGPITWADWFTPDVPSRDDVSFIAAKFQNPRLMMFEVMSLADISCNDTVSLKLIGFLPHFSI